MAVGLDDASMGHPCQAEKVDAFAHTMPNLACPASLPVDRAPGARELSASVKQSVGTSCG